MDLAQFWFQGAGGGPGPTPPFQLGNSLRFRGGTQSLSRTFSGAAATTLTHSFWVKGWSQGAQIFSWGTGGGGSTQSWIMKNPRANNTDEIGVNGPTPSEYGYYTSALYRDPAAWMHVVYTRPGSSAGQKLYVNGVEVTLNVQTGAWTNPLSWFTGPCRLGNGLNGHLAEIHAVDGAVFEPTTFGEFNADGVWVPREVELTQAEYGARGFYIDFSGDGTGTISDATIGLDKSGNGNDFTATGFELTDTTSTNYDWMADSPTDNYSTLNPLYTQAQGNAISNANLTGTGPAASYRTYPGTIGVNQGRWYWEWTTTSFNNGAGTGIMWQTNEQGPATTANSYGYNPWDRQYRSPDGVETYGEKGVSGDVFGCAFDLDAGTIEFFRNGTSQGQKTNVIADGRTYFPMLGVPFNTGNVFDANYGNRPFRFAPPAGFEPLSTANLEDVAITNPSDHFQTILGPGPSNGATPLGIQYKTSASADSPSATFQDQVYGKPATEAGAADDNHPMFTWASSLSLGGFDDWYIPARNEIEIVYRNLKPTTDPNLANQGANPNGITGATGDYTTSDPAQTTAAAFQSGGAEALSASTYWTATEVSISTRDAWRDYFGHGGLGNGTTNGKTDSFFARAIRRVAFTGSEPAIGAAYEGGFFAGLIDAKATPDGTATHALIVAPKDGGEYGVGTGILDVAQRTFPNGLWWIKDRANSNQHQFVDSVRGGNLAKRCPATEDESAYTAPAGNSVAWCWSAPDAFAPGSTGGLTNLSGQRNVAAGFSQIIYDGSGINGATFEHGLSQAPDMVMVSIRQPVAVDEWTCVSHTGIPLTQTLYLNTTSAALTRDRVTGRGPTSVTLSAHKEVNGPSNSHLAYCWHSVPGYSAFGSYVGNGNPDGPFIALSFRPSFILGKRITAGGDWYIKDSARSPYNPVSAVLYSSSTLEETSSNDIDFLSNGFKLRSGNGGTNQGGVTYVYAAFAEHPFGGGNVSPSPAR